MEDENKADKEADIEPVDESAKPLKVIINQRIVKMSIKEA